VAPAPGRPRPTGRNVEDVIRWSEVSLHDLAVLPGELDRAELGREVPPADFVHGRGQALQILTVDSVLRSSFSNRREPYVPDSGRSHIEARHSSRERAAPLPRRLPTLLRGTDRKELSL
jgi:hypothetical protein